MPARRARLSRWTGEAALFRTLSRRNGGRGHARASATRRRASSHRRSRQSRARRRGRYALAHCGNDGISARGRLSLGAVHRSADAIQSLSSPRPSSDTPRHARSLPSAGWRSAVGPVLREIAHGLRGGYRRGLSQTQHAHLAAANESASTHGTRPRTRLGLAQRRANGERGRVMVTLFARIRDHAEQRPHHLALADGAMGLDYRELLRAIERTEVSGHRVGLLLANSCAFAILDLALLSRGIVCVPKPPFLYDAQHAHIVRDAGHDTVITDQASRIALLASGEAAHMVDVAGRTLSCFSLRPACTPPLPHGTVKITYTSGTTGEPKGVCLTAANIKHVMQGLCEAVHANAQDQSLALLPLSTLLANIANLYAPLSSGGTAWLADLADSGVSGSIGVSRDAFVAALQRYRPTVTVVVPHLLKALVEAVAQGADWPRTLRFIAVGGAPVSAALLVQARRLGLPVYQGYGLSEAASVVSLNLPNQRRIGSVGRPLPLVQIRNADDGEVIVRGNLFAGYLGGPSPREEWPTGDLGYLSLNGYLYLTGRKKTTYATALGTTIATLKLQPSPNTAACAMARSAVSALSTHSGASVRPCAVA